MEILIGIFVYLIIRCVVTGFFQVNPNERAVKTIFGKAMRKGDLSTNSLPLAEGLTTDEKTRYSFPILDVIEPGLHFKLPWEKIYKISIATDTIDLGFDPERFNQTGDPTLLDAVTRDQLNVKLKGQLRFRVSESNLYAYFFGIKNPVTHVMGYFVSILREKIANFESKSAQKSQAGEVHLAENISINDLRKNLRDINDIMLKECQSSQARYGLLLEASLITSIESPPEVESALAAINTAYNNVSSEISLAKASADQTIVQSKRAVEIETLKVQAEIEPLVAMAKQLKILKAGGPQTLKSFVRNVRLPLFAKASRVISTQKMV